MTALPPSSSCTDAPLVLRVKEALGKRGPRGLFHVEPAGEQYRWLALVRGTELSREGLADTFFAAVQDADAALLALLQEAAHGSA